MPCDIKKSRGYYITSLHTTFLQRSPSDVQVQMDLGTFEVSLKYLVV